MKLINKARKLTVHPFTRKNVIVTWDFVNGKPFIKVDFDKGQGQFELMADKNFLWKATELYRDEYENE